MARLRAAGKRIELEHLALRFEVGPSVMKALTQGTTNVKPNQDTEQLRLLSIFHYVVAGILALFSMFPILHVVMGIAMVTGAFDNVGNGNRLPAFFGWMFIIFPSFIILCGMAMAVCIAIAGRRLSEVRSYTYCLVVAGIECIFMPFGTVLGVFTIIILMRPTVKQLFGTTQID